MPGTINTGTTAPTTVSIAGNDVNLDHTTIYIYEQTAAGTPTTNNSLLFGAPTTTHSAGTFATDQNGDDFADAVVLNGFNSYLLGATARLEIFIPPIRTAILSPSAPVATKSTLPASQARSSSVRPAQQERPVPPAGQGPPVGQARPAQQGPPAPRAQHVRQAPRV
jgi:hypothetical protein